MSADSHIPAKEDDPAAVQVSPDMAAAAAAFAALGSPQRLDVLRMLVRAGPGGLRVGQLAERTGIPASTLSHHLKTLIQAGLIAQERRGREIICIGAAFDVVHRLSTFLLQECCADVQGPDGQTGHPHPRGTET
jgi:DNA-binding transcriptional ArsR family regulator